MNELAQARFYTEKFGWFAIPAVWGAKNPNLPRWQKLRLTAEELPQYFNGGRQNIGIILGEPYGLCDVDFDAPECRLAWQEVGIDTGVVFGRKSNPASHHFYHSDPPVRTHYYDDPAPGPGQKKRIIELRGLGGQQIVPPSQHPSGEAYEFTAGRCGHPANIDKDVLEAAVRHIACAVLIARHAKEGTRHFSFLALAGALARAGWHREKTENLLHAVYRILWEKAAKLNDADREVGDTYDKVHQSKETTGLPTLKNLLDKKVFDKLIEWLALSFEESPPKLEPLWTPTREAAAAAPAPAPQMKKLPPDARPIDDLKGLALRQPVEIVQSCVTQPGVTLVCASNKAGKTVLAVQIAMSVATGQDLFNYYQTHQAPTLILEWDDLQGKAELEQYRQKARASQPGMPFHYVALDEEDENPLTLNDPEFLPYLKAQIERTGAKLIVLDSYSALRGVRGRNIDVVKLDAEDIYRLVRIARDYNCAILLVHHDSKTSANLDWASRSAGSYAIGAASDAIIYLTRYPELAEDEGSRLVSVRSRRMAGAEFCVRYCEESKDFDLILTGPGARDYPEIKKLYRAFPSIHFLHKEASEALGVSTTQVYRICSRLVASGVLRKEPTGWKWDADFDLRGLREKKKTNDATNDSDL